MKTIRAKLWLGMMVLVGMIILLLWLFQIVFIREFYSSLEIDEVSKNAKHIIKEMEQSDYLDQIAASDDIKAAMDELVYKKQLSLEIINQSYDTVYWEAAENNVNMPGMLKEKTASVEEQALQGNASRVEVTHPRFGTKFMMMGYPISIKGTVQGAMIIRLPMASIEDTKAILKKQLILITFILLVISIIISYKLSKNLAKPITRISKQADQFASGNFKDRIDGIGEDEIGQLAKRMNTMGEALENKDVLQKEIIANVSHELRTPLALIRGYAETLRDVTGDNPVKREKQLGIIVEETERLTTIVEDILGLSRLQSGAVVLEQEPFSLYEMLLKIKENYELQPNARTFQVIGAAELREPLYGDKKRLEQVFYNLIHNAFRHTKDNTAVEVVVTPEQSRVKIEVIDHGEGISKEDLEHVFERYYKGSASPGNKERGTGLGLAIVKSILEMHEVSYGVNSELGKGTTFWFELYKADSHTSF